jgi:hypothetical protein
VGFSLKSAIELLIMTFNFKEQLELVERIKIREGDFKRIDCPFCGGKKTFTLDRHSDGKLLWNCYKASCGARGVKQYGRSLNAAKRYISGSEKENHQRTQTPLPDITTNVRNKADALEYLKSVNSLEALDKGLIRIRFAPQANRVLFYNQDGSGAVGRLLSGKGPKWLSYGDVSGGIHVGSSKIGVLVEDAASACSIARLQDFTGIGLLGTNLTSQIKNSLHLYNQLYIILDNDAANKAVRMSRKLRGSVLIRMTKDDPKDLTIHELTQLLTSKQTN